MQREAYAGNARVVRTHDHGRALLVDTPEKVHDLDAGDGIELTSGFVGQEQGRAVDQGARQRNALAHAHVHLFDAARALGAEFHLGAHLQLDDARGLDHLAHFPERERFGGDDARPGIL